MLADDFRAAGGSGLPGSDGGGGAARAASLSLGLFCPSISLHLSVKISSARTFI